MTHDPRSRASGDDYTYDSERRLFLRTSALATVGLLAGGLRALAEGTCAPGVRTDRGPFYPSAEIAGAADLTTGAAGAARGRLLHVFGRVTDAGCRPLAGARVEIWQADHEGRYRHDRAEEQDRLDPNFRYFAHVTTGEDGAYRFRTIVPRRYSVGDIERAPHIHFRVGHPASRPLTTEMYFTGEEDDRLRSRDSVYQGRDQATRGRMIVEPRAADDGALACEYDLVLTPA